MRRIFLIATTAICMVAVSRAQQDTSCAEHVARAIREVAQSVTPGVGGVVTYVIETAPHQAGTQATKDTVQITRSSKVLMIESRQGVFVYTTETSVQVVTAAKRMVISKPAKSLQKIASKAQSEALMMLIELIATSAKTACEREASTGNFVVTTEVKSGTTSQIRHKPITSVGSSKAHERSQPTSITSVVTSAGVFVSISCTYPKGAPAKTLTVSNVITRKARQEELDAANQVLQKLITKNGKPAAAYRDYTVLDLRNIGRAIE